MKTLHLFVVCIAVLFSPAFSQATLGASVNSKATNLTAVNASQKVGSTEKYSNYEYEQNGNTVKEFSSSEGVVFAVSWRGISKPDLNALFGSYFNEYTEAFDKVPKQYGVKSLSMKTTQMVIRRGGRMRDQSGFVYVPSLVPEGVNVEDLK
ncbi:DUF2844 domain-containing protein [Bdellovibrio sp. HCB337]|uniref:DUF2844 domain-containing protein n=1 Tax=Bdellovibrio sp. HCB337 TaxID=3394358 RepID=UPI0039A4A4F1